MHYKRFFVLFYAKQSILLFITYSYYTKKLCKFQSKNQKTFQYIFDKSDNNSIEHIDLTTQKELHIESFLYTKFLLFISAQ